MQQNTSKVVEISESYLDAILAREAFYKAKYEFESNENERLKQQNELLKQKLDNHLDLSKCHCQKCTGVKNAQEVLDQYENEV